MTTAELRTLLERVEKHGGPVRVDVGEHGNVRVMTEDDVWWLNDAKHGVVQEHHLIGVLKRDLIERGFNLSVVYDTGLEPAPWQATLTYPLEAPIDPPPYYGAFGDSELEAALRAYLAAAKAEGWTP